MALFVLFTAHLSVPADPMEFFPSIEVAVNEMRGRGLHRRGQRAPVAGLTAHTYRTWQRTREQAEWPALTDPDGWMALAWWRKAGQEPPQPTVQAGEVWCPAGLKIERTRLNIDEWNTGRIKRFRR